MSRSAFLLMSVLCLFLALAGFLVWAVLAGGYRTGVVIPAAVVLGVTVVGLNSLGRESRVGPEWLHPMRNVPRGH